MEREAGGGGGGGGRTKGKAKPPNAFDIPHQSATLTFSGFAVPGQR